MKEKRSLLRILCAERLLLILATLALAVFFVYEITVRNTQMPITRALLLCVICLLFYLGGYLLSQKNGNRLVLKRLFLLFLILYVYLLLSLTLLDPMGRGEGSVYGQIERTRAAYTRRFVNLVPLRSIYHVYIKGFLKGYVNTYYTLFNLLGNVVALMPLAFFLPYFFPMQRKWYCFLPTVTFVVILIEFLQYLFMIGSCDVDDLILNAGGAFLCFLLLKIPLIQKLILKLT